MLYFNILAQTKRFRNSVLTNNLRVIRHAWHFYNALILVVKVVCGSIVLRASHLNWALALGWHQRLKVSVFIGFFSAEKFSAKLSFFETAVKVRSSYPLLI